MRQLPINHPLVQFVRRLGDWIVSPLGAIAAFLLAVAIFGCAYTVDQTEQVVITQFGRPVGEPINAAGSASGAGPSPPSTAFATRGFGARTRSRCCTRRSTRRPVCGC